MRALAVTVGTAVTAASRPGLAILWIVLAIVVLALIVVAIVGCWKVFEKAGEHGWACLIPFYNYFVFVRIARRPVWWFWVILACNLLNAFTFGLSGIASLVFAVLLIIDVTKAFGKGAGFTVGMIFLFPIFLCILGFGPATYDERRVGRSVGGDALASTWSGGPVQPTSPPGWYATATPGVQGYWNGAAWTAYAQWDGSAWQPCGAPVAGA